MASAGRNEAVHDDVLLDGGRGSDSFVRSIESVKQPRGDRVEAHSVVGSDLFQDRAERSERKDSLRGDTNVVLSVELRVKRRWLPVWRVIVYPKTDNALASSAPERSLGSFIPR